MATRAGAQLGLACICLAVLAATINAQAPYKLPPLRFATNALVPYIDNETMVLHHDKHHGTAVTNLNIALGKAPVTWRKQKLTALLRSLPKKTDDITKAVKNNAGSHFNHAQYWRNLRPIGSGNVISPALQKAINKSFGSYSKFNDTFSTAASKLFGSGWVWLIYKPVAGALAVVSTPNQDNPLMKNYVDDATYGIPILGIDLWEHAYYLNVRNVRNKYIANWWKVVNWPQVSSNYAKALKNDLEDLWRDD